MVNVSAATTLPITYTREVNRVGCTKLHPIAFPKVLRIDEARVIHTGREFFCDNIASNSTENLKDEAMFGRRPFFLDR